MVAEVRVSLSSIYVSHCPSPHHPLPPFFLSLFSLSLSVRRGHPFLSLLQFHPLTLPLNLSISPPPRPCFLPLFMCLLKIVRPAADAILLHSAGPLSPVGRAMTHSLSLSLVLSLLSLVTYLPFCRSLQVSLSPSLPPSPFLQCAHEPTDVQLPTTSARSEANTKVSEGSTAMSKRMTDTLLHNEQTAPGRDRILISHALLIKAGLLDTCRVS